MIKPYYNDELGELYNCDCRNLLTSLKEDSVDMVFTSPPYNTGNSGKNKGMYKEYIDNISDSEYYNLLSILLKESLRICKGPIFLNINYMVNNKNVLYKVISDFSEYLRENIIWDKGPNRSTIPIGNILMKRYEYIFLFTKNPKFEINNFRVNKAVNYKERFGKWISNLFYMPPDYENLHLVKKHRAGFPIELPKMFVDIFTKEKDVVLDPFMGLGSTALACEMLNRRWIGSELIPEYCEIVKTRLEKEPLKLY